MDENKLIRVRVIRSIRQKDEKTYVNFFAKATDGTFMNVKFTKDIQTLPQENSVILLYENDCNISISEGANGKFYKTLWIKAYNEIYPEKTYKVSDFFTAVGD